MGSKIWTAAELEQLTPAERHELFEASTVTNLDDVDPALLAKVRSRLLERIEDETS